MLEFCDKGNLQDACDRGMFNMRRHGGAAEAPRPNVRAVTYAHTPATNLLLHSAGDELAFTWMTTFCTQEDQRQALLVYALCCSQAAVSSDKYSVFGYTWARHVLHWNIHIHDTNIVIVSGPLISKI